MKHQLLEKIEDKSLKIGVIGLGYVGLPLAVEKARAGYQVTGFDIQKKKVDMVNRGENYIGDVIGDELKHAVESGKLRATSDYSFIGEMDFIAICVPTPLDANQQPDISYVKRSAEAIAKHLKRASVVVLESTTYPGTTEQLLLPILEEGSGLRSEEDFYLAFSPERVDPGNLHYKTKNTPKVVGGVGKDATEVVATLYRKVIQGEIFEASTPRVAEMEKILENTYRNVNIALINEMAMICHRMGIDVWEVIEAAKTKPYGFQAFYPGPGLGGHCIPLDPYYLSWKAREFDFHTTLIETSGTVNDKMPYYVVERIMKILNEQAKSVKGSRILILGVAYKKDIDDYRESPALQVIRQLEELGGLVEYFDPHIPYYCYKGLEKSSLSELTEEIIKNADLVVATADHSSVDYHWVSEHAKAIFDTKNAFKGVEDRTNIERL